MSLHTSLIKRWRLPFIMAAAIFAMAFGGLQSAPGRSAQDRGLSDPSWPGPEGGRLAFGSHQQALEFLRKARVVSKREIGSGINDTLRLTLRAELASGPKARAGKSAKGADIQTSSLTERSWQATADKSPRGAVEVYAVFRDVDLEINRTTQVSGRFVVRFRDNYVYEVAAYKLSRLLGVDQVPPTVLRRFERRPGSVQLWIYDGMSETKRRQEGLKPPDDQMWTRQIQTKLLFDRLINNLDRNLGNQLIDRNWKLWLIDHTRSFGPQGELRSPQAVYWCSERVYQALKTLDHEDVRRELKGLLRSDELRALLVRWEKLTAHLDSLIEKRGSQSVLF